MNLCRIIFLISLICLQYNLSYASSKYEDSIFSICFLKFNKSTSNKLNPNKIDISNFITREMKEKDLLTQRASQHKQEIEYILMSSSQMTAFYIGNGRFVANFHLLLQGHPMESYQNLFIQYKDKIIHINKVLQYDSISDLLVVHSNSEEIKDLVPLSIGIPEVPAYGDVISGFDYRYNKIIDLEVSDDLSLVTKDEYNQIFIPSQNVRSGMGGSPLLYRNKVTGVLCSATLDRFRIACFSLSSNLLKLLKTKELNCTLDECLVDGVKYMISEAQRGNENAKATLKIHLHSNKYMRDKYLDDH